MTSIPKNTAIFGRPVLPRADDLMPLIAEMIASERLSNCGPLHDRLESALSSRFGASVKLVSSGSMALMMALKLGGLRPGSEIITSPLSFAASVQAISWCGYRPVFADVSAVCGTLCPRAVERAITPDTTAILAVHFQGIACDIDALSDVARRHGLWLVFDAAQAPDIVANGQSIALAGDVSALSFHATKLLNTGEGGAIVTRDAALACRAAQMRNFGLDAGEMQGSGINGKLSELHSALGLAVLPRLDAELAARLDLRRVYDGVFHAVHGIEVLRPRNGTSESHLYYTLKLPAERRPLVMDALQAAAITPRAPFPLLTDPAEPGKIAQIVTHNQHGPIAPDVMRTYLSLPMNGDIDPRRAEHVAQTVVRAMG